MKPVMKVKISIDAAMTLALLLLMAYGLVGEAAHEWLGMGMFALFLLHHLLNRRWIRAVPRTLCAPTHRADGADAAAPSDHAGLHGQRCDRLAVSVSLSGWLRPYVMGGKAAMLCAYWGLRADDLAWNALEHGAEP